MSDEKKMDNNAETIVKVIGTLAEKTVVPIYEDLAKPSLKQIGEGLGGFLSFAMTPLQIMGYQADHWKNEFQKSLDKKASKIPKGRLQTPELVITGSIMQALGYTVHEEDIREMFTNLLVTAMDSEIAHKAHPSFVEIIKQLTPDEAKIIKLFGDSKIKGYPIVDLKYLQGRDYQIIIRNHSYIPKDSGCKNPQLGSEYLDNLCRIGITEITKDSKIAGDNAYAKHEQWFSNLMQEKIDPENFQLLKKIISITDFGELFISTCVGQN